MKLFQTKRTEINIYHTFYKTGGFSLLAFDWDFDKRARLNKWFQIDIYFLFFEITIFWEEI